MTEASITPDKASQQNPELPVSFIKLALRGKAEMWARKITPFQFDNKPTI